MSGLYRIWVMDSSLWTHTCEILPKRSFRQYEVRVGLQKPFVLVKVCFSAFKPAQTRFLYWEYNNRVTFRRFIIAWCVIATVILYTYETI